MIRETERIRNFIRETCDATGSRRIVIGLSGGIDSALAAALAAGAVGGEIVLGLTLPSAVTPQEDIEDAGALCRAFGITHRVIGIAPVVNAYRRTEGFEDTPYLVGNLMARTRMALLYYHANRIGGLVCGTSNRSEYLLGYCTKHGDDAADLQPILHLYKTDVYALSRSLGLPEAILGKEPSAGLWPGQRDEDELGMPYPEIDRALIALERKGWEASTPAEERVLALVRKGAHKRLPVPSLLTGTPGIP
ncbi:MAG: NAD+ synthase [Methanomicrobiaceae archaeon]|nr:NAD+ synthase [Methanomicrobiaceae archaeon]